MRCRVRVDVVANDKGRESLHAQHHVDSGTMLSSVFHLKHTSSATHRLVPFPVSSSLSRLKRIRENSDVALNRAFIPQKLYVSTIDPDLALLTLLLILVTAERREAPILRHNDLLAAGEFVLRASEGFDGSSTVCTE